MRSHGSALGLGLLLLSGCGDAPEARVLPIVAVVPEACEDADPATIQLEALGDFDASPFTSETITSQSESGTPLSFPVSTRAVEARGDGAGARFLGLGEVGPEGGVDLLLLPDDRSCDLFQPGASRPFPLAVEGVGVGFSSRHRVLLIAGGMAASGESARALALHVDTTEAADVPSGMIPGRAWARVTEFGDDALLVSGGVDPTEPTQPEIESAIVYDVEQNRFERGALIPLSKRRARHGAVVLAGGDTLLVGGSVDGKASTSLEAVSPLDRAARILDLVALDQARIAPSVLRLDDDRVFIGGGTDDTGSTVQTLEWLSPDAAEHLAGESVGIAETAAFAAMPGGGVLAVGVCPTPPCTGAEVAWIRADYQPDALEPLPFAPIAPALVAGTDGSPLLVATTPSGTRVLLRFDPWTARFVAPSDASEPPSAGFVPIAVDPGMFVWLEPFGSALSVRAFRHDTRGTWARDVAPLVLGGTAHLAPDRRPGSSIAYTGVLSLTAAGRVFIADTTYDALRLELDLVKDTTTLPIVALNDELFGGDICPWPGATGDKLVLIREGTEVTLERGGESRRCDVAKDRVRVALVAPADAKSLVRSVTVRRSAE